VVEAVTDAAVVVAVDHPSRRGGGERIDALTELVGVALLPVRQPVDAVELEVRNAELLGDGCRRRRLARSWATDDPDPKHDENIFGNPLHRKHDVLHSNMYSEAVAPPRQAPFQRWLGCARRSQRCARR
jgi:hypothetical protein